MANQPKAVRCAATCDIVRSVTWDMLELAVQLGALVYAFVLAVNYFYDPLVEEEHDQECS